MSWILLWTLGILVLFGFVGWKKGIIRIVVSIASLIIVILATAFLSPLIASTIKKNTNLYDNLSNYMYEVISNNENMSNAVENAVEENADIPVAPEEIAQYESVIDEYLDKIQGYVPLPDAYSGDLWDMISAGEFSTLLEGNGTIKNVVTRAFALRLADVIFQTVIYIILFVVIYAVLRIVTIATGIISRLPVIHGANKMLGLAFGIVEGLILVWILYLILTAMSGTEWAGNAIIDINNNGLLKLIYDNNIIMKLIF